jgi:cytochrome bd-type quinol oxidase subunit 2
VLLVSGLKLINVPTLAIGIVLLGCVVVLGASWLAVRASGRTLREISGETDRPAPAMSHRAEEPALSTP